MKNNFYTSRLIRQNSLYIGAFLFFFALLVYILAVQLRSYIDYKNKIPTLEQEVAQLAQKKAIVYSFDPDETDELISTLNTLLPNTEDYFSIVNTLNSLASQTGFQIDSYTIQIPEDGTTVNEQVLLTVSGAGSPEAFESLLANYPYKGGRFISMDKVQYSVNQSSAELSLTFYSKAVNVDDKAQLPDVNQKILTTVRKMNNDLEALSAKDTAQQKVNIDYTVKEDPFGL